MTRTYRIVFILMLIAAQLSGATSSSGGPTLVVSPSPSEPNQQITLTADKGNATIFGQDTSGRPSYRFLEQAPGQSSPVVFQNWSTSKTATRTPSAWGKYLYVVHIQLMSASGQPSGNPLAKNITHYVGGPVAPVLNTPAAGATVNGDSGVTFKWSDTAQGGNYFFCLSKTEAMGCASSTDSKTRTVSTTGTTFSKSELSGFTGIPLWWNVRAQKSGYTPAPGTKRQVTINVTPTATVLTWTTVMTAESLGETPSSTLQGKTLQRIVDSFDSGRIDGKKCSECHHSTTSKLYRPPITAAQQSVPTATSIPRGDGNGMQYQWNQSGTTGIVEKFCVAVTPEGPKPADLCRAFRKWAADQYRNP